MTKDYMNAVRSVPEIKVHLWQELLSDKGLHVCT